MCVYVPWVTKQYILTFPLKGNTNIELLKNREATLFSVYILDLLALHIIAQFATSEFSIITLHSYSKNLHNYAILTVRTDCIYEKSIQWCPTLCGFTFYQRMNLKHI